MTRIHILVQTHEKDGYLMSYSPPFSQPPPPPQQPNPSPSGSKISPAVLFIIVILAVLFFISGLLHLLVRFLIKNPNPHSSSSSSSSSPSRPQEFSTSDALQRQLQQLFHLHDSGLDQSFIDSLPVFHYREIVGPTKVVEPFDCAVCLCEFSDRDKLRLLPLCGHAFHIGCIDTWLLSNSTCPLCRSALFSPPGFSVENPVFDLHDDDDVAVGMGTGRKARGEIEEADVVAVEAKGVLPVRLGKFRRVDNRAEPSEPLGVGGESSRLDSRRCFSMGSYEYVLGDSALRVVARPSRETGESDDVVVGDDSEGKKMSKGESFSVSKIWLWSRKGKFSTSSEADSNPGMVSSLNVDLPWMRKN